MLPEWDNATNAQAPALSFFTRGRHIPYGDSYIIADQAYVQYIPPTPPPPASSKSFSSLSRSNSPPPPMFGSPSPDGAPLSRSSWAAARPQQPVPSTLVPKRPLLFIHGGGLTGSIWETTPDRRPGWALRASQAGRPIYLLDAIDCGRSARPPEALRDGEVQYRSAKHVWERFRIGPIGGFEAQDAFEATQFPTDCFDRFLAMQVERRHGAGETEIIGIVDAIKEIGECDVIAHSHGALLLVQALAQDQDLKGIVQKVMLVEPGTPVPEVKEIRGLSRKMEDLTIVWCDHVDTHGLWQMVVTEWEGVLKRAPVLRLPDLGITGNSHIPMCDRNSDEVIELLLQRL